MKIAIVGATGIVGSTFLKVLEEFKIKADYYLFASQRSAGKVLKFMGKNYTIIELNRANIEKVKPDYALLAAGGSTSTEFAPIFAELGCIVIDNSSAFRRDPEIPLVVPECNPEDAIKTKSKILANPNCSTIGAVVALKPLDDLYKIKRLVYSTYQAVSGAGQAGVDDYLLGLAAYAKGEKCTPKKFQYQIFNNLIPQIDTFLENGNTKEEDKMIFETRKILGRQNIAISATTVRVPIENCHSISINIEFEKTPDIAHIKKVLAKSPGVVLVDDPANFKYPMPSLANDRNEVFVGRVRLDESKPNCINLFTVSDNIRKGAATNAVQILQLLIK
jgi:aspartate-semialdehyde dehydrogenase